MAKPTFASDESYGALLDGLKAQIRTAQVKAVLAVNRELVLLYWQIGREILTRQQAQGWGGKVIDRLSKDLKQEFPEVQGFGARNLKYMRAFADAYPELEVVQQLAAQIPWGHNCLLLDKIKPPTVRQWYMQQTIANGWSRNGLALQIESGIYG